MLLPIVVFQLLAASSVSAIVVSFKLQSPFAWLGLEEPPHHLPPFPFPHPKPPRPPTHTVYDLIHSDDRFTKLNKAFEFVGDDIISILNDTNRQLTYFAVPDSALVPPHKKHPDHDHDKKKKKKHKHKHKHLEGTNSLLDLALSADTNVIDESIKALLLDNSVSLVDALELIDEIEAVDCVMDDDTLINVEEPRGDDGDDDDDDDDDKKERRKRIFRHIVKAILNYHILPLGAYDIDTLVHNTTYPTNFHVPKLFGGHGQRVTVSQHVKEKKKKTKTSTFINLYAKVTAQDIKADNGYIHVINHPLLPPPAIFQELFLAQHHFSTFTSALQRVGLTDELDVRYVKDGDDEHGRLEGSTAVTTFAPTNEAFGKLPPRALLYLFSPFGERALRKLLEYHIIPGVVAHADVLYNQTAETNPGDDLLPDYEVLHPPTHKKWSLFEFGETRHPISTVNITFNTRLVNYTIDWSVEKYQFSSHGKDIYETKVFVNKHPVLIPDLVALNGAVHVVDHVLCPFHHKEPINNPPDGGLSAIADPWEDWEEWLPRWGDSA
ncbi:fasciclin domain family protein [Coprinopsis cinerea okayama7|uniref:Fasciclin domain family protein n=1 Tax=Coprinopsis cinerea (strain Okayama-7 / 130 / ATCC MYA-4618 / FGSC 9003) TaxID=240176 RepID=A8NG67_COPC7|nr:fasciclin domain family protein [Coprinopsis cinerea okayama7\|eukprot:XP_001833492.1 fasciclin domain family protein [Coprinopsis cinerea okayama7\